MVFHPFTKGPQPLDDLKEHISNALSFFLQRDEDDINDDDDDLFDGFVNESNDVDTSSASLEQKEAQLRKKKLMLQKVLKKLRQMITEAESNAAEKSLRGQSSSPSLSPSLKLIEKFEDLEPQPSISFSQILPLKTKKKVKVVKVAKDDLQFEARSSNVDAIPWWERIYSNRH